MRNGWNLYHHRKAVQNNKAILLGGRKAPRNTVEPAAAAGPEVRGGSAPHHLHLPHTRAPRNEQGSPKTHKGLCIPGSPFTPFSFDSLPDNVSARNPTQGTPQLPAKPVIFFFSRAVRLRHIWVFHMQQMQQIWLLSVAHDREQPHFPAGPAEPRRRRPFVEVSAPRPATPSFKTPRRRAQTSKASGLSRARAEPRRPPLPRPLRTAPRRGGPGTPAPPASPPQPRSAAKELKANTQRG